MSIDVKQSRGQWRQPVPLVLSLAAVVIVAIAVLARVKDQELAGWDLTTVGCLALAMFAGELMQVRARGQRGIAPIATASAMALTLAYDVAGHPLSYGAASVVLTSVVALLVGVTAVTLRTGQQVNVAGYAIRVIMLATVALTYRELPIASDRSLSEVAASGGFERWELALIMLGLALGAQLLELGLHVWLRTATGSRGWRAILTEDVREMLPIALAAMSTGVVVALGMRGAGIVAVALFLSPLVLMRFALRRQQSARRARQQAITALSRMTDLAGYTRTGHAERVALLCTDVGRRLHLADRDLVDLEGAALLHDIGQVALRHPVPDGATVGLAPVDQQRIADDAAEIVRRTGALDDAAEIIREHPTQFRLLREEGEALSQAARILKVCNAFDDLSAGDPARRDPALERIMLGLGYEYDPEVVSALRVLTEP